MIGLKFFKDDAAILRRNCDQVRSVGDEERILLQALLKMMYENKGVGLAAPQVGISRRLVVVDIGQGPLQLVNPEIVSSAGRKEALEEGCLSLPKISVTVKRSPRITVRAWDESGEEKEIIAEGLLSRALQHEIDHLSGRLIIDYLPWYQRLTFKSK